MAANARRSFYEPRELTIDVVQNTLALVGVTIGRHGRYGIGHWTPLERLIAYDWALRCHLRASDNPTQLRPKPNFVEIAENASVVPFEGKEMVGGWFVDFYDAKRNPIDTGDVVPYRPGSEIVPPSNASFFTLRYETHEVVPKQPISGIEVSPFPGTVVEHGKLQPPRLLSDTVTLNFWEDELRALGVKRIELANYQVACPAGKGVVAQAVVDANDRHFLHGDGTICEHGFIAPDRTWIGPWDPA
jgi:hypothetical protein